MIKLCQYCKKYYHCTNTWQTAHPASRFTCIHLSFVTHFGLTSVLHISFWFPSFHFKVIVEFGFVSLLRTWSQSCVTYSRHVGHIYIFSYVITVGPILTKFGKNGNQIGTTSKTWSRITFTTEAKRTMGSWNDALKYIYVCVCVCVWI